MLKPVRKQIAPNTTTTNSREVPQKVATRARSLRSAARPHFADGERHGPEGADGYARRTPRG